MKLLQLARAYVEADEALNQCVRASGYEAGHWCYDARERLAGAESAFEAELVRLIDERIASSTTPAEKV